MESTLVSYQKLVRARRWDFEYFDPEYQTIVDSIESSGWKICKLGEIVINLTDGQHGYLVHLPEGIPLLRTTNIFENEIRLDDVRYIAPEVHTAIKRSQLKAGDVLLTTIGSLGIAAVVDNSLGEANINQNLVKMTPKPEVNPLYLSLFLNSNLGKVQTQRTASKSVVPIINYSRLKDIVIPVPPRSLQDQIAQVMQVAYSDRQKKLKQAKNLLNSSSRVVLEELDLEISELKDQKHFTVSISKIAGGRFDLDLYNTCYTGLIALLREKFGSNLSSLKSLSQPITSGATPLGSKYFETGVPFLRVQNLNGAGEINLDNCLFISEDFAKTLKRAVIQNDDILLVIVGATIGKSAVVKDIKPPSVTNQALARIRIRETVDLLPEFLQAFLSSPAGQIQISALKRPVAQGNLSLTETGQILVPIVSLDQQKKVISRIQDYRSEAKRLRSQAEAVVAAAKARVERMILGEEVGDG